MALEESSHPEVIVPLVERTVQRFSNKLGYAHFGALVQDIDEALDAGAPVEYLTTLLDSTENWNDACTVCEIASTASRHDVPPEYAIAVWRFSYSHGDLMTIGERVVVLHENGVPPEYIEQFATRRFNVARIAEAWASRLSPDYAEILL